MRRDTPKTWWLVKAKITSRFGTVAACAAVLRCSPDGLRKAVDGQCPGIAQRLKHLIQFDWEVTTEAAV